MLVDGADYADVGLDDWLEVQDDCDVLMSRLSVARSKDLAKICHGDEVGEDGTTKLSHLETVSDWSCCLVQRYCSSVDTPLCVSRYTLRLTECAAWLHECMGLSRNAFETVIDAADESVARAVADLTPDWRLDSTRRIVEYANRVGRSKPYVQIIKACDYLDEALLLKCSVEKEAAGVNERARAFHEHALVVSDSLHALEEFRAGKNTLERLHNTLKFLEDACDLRQRRRGRLN